MLPVQATSVFSFSFTDQQWEKRDTNSWILYSCPRFGTPKRTWSLEGLNGEGPSRGSNSLSKRKSTIKKKKAGEWESTSRVSTGSIQSFLFVVVWKWGLSRLNSDEMKGRTHEKNKNQRVQQENKRHSKTTLKAINRPIFPRRSRNRDWTPQR